MGTQEAIICSQWLNILDAVAAANGAPSGATAGVAIPINRKGKVIVFRLRHTTTDGDDVRTCTIKLWGYCAGAIDADGAAISASAGWDDMDESYLLASVSADGMLTIWVTEAASIYSRLYVELTAIAGTGTAISVDIGLTEE